MFVCLYVCLKSRLSSGFLPILVWSPYWWYILGNYENIQPSPPSVVHWAINVFGLW